MKAAEIDGRLDNLGIDKVYVLSVNDGAVVTAWKIDQGLAGSDMIEFIADTQASFTEAMGIVLTGFDKPYSIFEGPNKALGHHTKRCKRTAMYIENGILKIFQIAESVEDPAGDNNPYITCIENMIKLIG